MVVGRRRHTTAVIHLDNARKRLIHFGGLPATRREGDALADTSIVEISEYGCEVICVLAPNHCTLFTNIILCI